MKIPLALARCNSYERDSVCEAVQKSVALLGGIDHFIRPGSKVLLKPNLLMDIAPDECVTTHPVVVEAVIRLLATMKVKLYLGDSPSSVGAKKDIERVYEVTGMKDVCERHKVTCVYFDAACLKQGIPIAQWTQDCDYIINIPKFKAHTLTVLTGAIKNMYGCVTGIHKAKIHRDHFEVSEFSKKIVDVFAQTKPSLTIVDAITCLAGDGPGTAGIKTQTGFILSGSDCVAIDSILASVMGISAMDIFTTKNAFDRGLGEARRENIEIRGDALENLPVKNFKLPSVSGLYKLPQFVRNALKHCMAYKMCVNRDTCRSCGKCIQACPVNAISYKNKKADINTAHCILCSCCQEVCPYEAITIKKSLLLRMAGV